MSVVHIMVFLCLRCNEIDREDLDVKDGVVFLNLNFAPVVHVFCTTNLNHPVGYQRSYINEGKKVWQGH